MTVTVLGGGPAGLYAALLVARRGIPVVVVEKDAAPGGLTAGFEVDGLAVDFGSHRLHPSIHPDLLMELRQLMEDQLQERTRRGRIRMGDSWISFPISAPELAIRLPASTVARLAGGALRAMLRPNRSASFADVVSTGLGKPMGDLFYFPYAAKIWGVDPQHLSGEQARRRISADSPAKLARKALERNSGRTFYYPRGGFGQIARELARAAEEAGAEIRLESPVTSIMPVDHGYEVQTPQGTLNAGLILSTIPITTLSRFLGPPEAVRHSLDSLGYRAMVLVYLRVPKPQWTEYDAHYFPGADVPFTRLSEPKNYRDGNDPPGHTVLCVEIPADRNDAIWQSDDVALLTMVRQGIVDLDLPDPGTDGMVHRIPFAYPIYRQGSEAAFTTVADWLDTKRGLVSYGRQGLYAHDNTHHALAMARDAVACIRDDLSFDRAAWAAARERFARHVVED